MNDGIEVRIGVEVDDALSQVEAELFALAHGILTKIAAGGNAAATVHHAAARSGYHPIELTRTAIALLTNTPPRT